MSKRTLDEARRYIFHEYDEIVIVQKGTSRFVTGDEIWDATAGNIVVVKAGTPHGFINSGEGLLKQIDIHVSSRFKQQILDSTDTSRKAHLPSPDNGKGELEATQPDA